MFRTINDHATEQTALELLEEITWSPGTARALVEEASALWGTEIAYAGRLISVRYLHDDHYEIREWLPAQRTTADANGMNLA